MMREKERYETLNDRQKWTPMPDVKSTQLKGAWSCVPGSCTLDLFRDGFHISRLIRSTENAIYPTISSHYIPTAIFVLSIRLQKAMCLHLSHLSHLSPWAFLWHFSCFLRYTRNRNIRIFRLEDSSSPDFLVKTRSLPNLVQRDKLNIIGSMIVRKKTAHPDSSSCVHFMGNMWQAGRGAEAEHAHVILLQHASLPPPSTHHPRHMSLGNQSIYRVHTTEEFFPMDSLYSRRTGWHIRLVKTSCWHWFESCVLKYKVLVLKRNFQINVGGFYQPDVSPCSTLLIYVKPIQCTAQQVEVTIQK